MDSNSSRNLILQDSDLGLPGVRCCEVYYPDSIADAFRCLKPNGYDIVNLIHIDQNQISSLASICHHVYQKTSTIRIDLNLDENIILENFSATLRNNCRNGMASPDLSLRIYQPNRDQILGFCDHLKSFYLNHLKLNNDLSFYYNHHSLLEDCGNLFYSDAFFKEKMIKRRSYLVNHKLARLLNSIQLNPALTTVDKKTVGFANAASHWNDICFFKKNGYHVYDLGGVHSDMRDGVSQYKSKFSKIITNLYDVFFPISPRGQSCMRSIAQRWSFKGG